MASEVYGLSCDLGGRMLRVVARRYVRDLPLGEGPPTVEGEASVLTQLEGLDIAAPRLIGFDPSGSAAGHPTVVMTRLPGRLDLQPHDPEAWTCALAEMLCAVHNLVVDAPPYRPWYEPAEREVREWTTQPELWTAALEVLASPPPAEAHGFVHGDYQQFNVLWHRGSISGVLDWTGSWLGPQDVDVAHARLNLACLYGVERAEAFRRAYEAAAGRPMSPWRDLYELVGYVPGFAIALRRQIAGRMVLEVPGMSTRVEELLRLTLKRT